MSDSPMSTTRAAINASIGACMWGIGGVCSNILFTTTDASPEWIVSMRLTFAGILMLLFAAATKKPLLRVWRTPASAIRQVAFGIVGVFLAQLTYMLAIFYGNVAIATIMLSLVPALITIVFCVTQRSLPRLIDALAIIIALAGVFLLVTDGNPGKLHVAPLAVFWGFIAACTGAAYTLLPRKLLMQESPLVVVGWGLIVGSVAANLWHPVWRLPQHLHPVSWLMIAFVVLGATLLAYILYVSSLKVLRPAIAGMIGNFEPLTATILSVAFLNLAFHPLQLAGIISVLGAVFMMSWQPRKKRDLIPRRQ